MRKWLAYPTTSMCVVYGQIPSVPLSQLLPVFGIVQRLLFWYALTQALAALGRQLDLR